MSKITETEAARNALPREIVEAVHWLLAAARHAPDGCGVNDGASTCECGLQDHREAVARLLLEGRAERYVAECSEARRLKRWRKRVR